MGTIYFTASLCIAYTVFELLPVAAADEISEKNRAMRYLVNQIKARN